MITMELDGALCYAPHIQDPQYAVMDLKQTGEIGKADTLVMTIPACNRAYGTARPLKSNVILREDGQIGFYGRVLSIQRDFWNNQEITCEGALAFLNDSIVSAKDTSIYPTWNSTDKTGSYSGTPETFVRAVLAKHNAQVTADRQIQMGIISTGSGDEPASSVVATGYYKDSSSPVHYTGTADSSVSGYQPVSWFASRASSWGYGNTRRVNMEKQGLCYELIQNAVNAAYGSSKRFELPASAYVGGVATVANIEVEASGYLTAWDALQAEGISDAGYTLSVRAEVESDSIVVYLDLLSKEGSQGEQEIRFGRNLLDLEEYIDAAEIYTRVIPLGKNDLTIASVNSGEIYLENAALAAVYGQITKTVSHTDISNATKLKTAGQEDLKAMLSAAISLTIKAVDLTITGDADEAFYVGGWNRVYSPPHGYDEFLQCTRIVRNLQDPGRDEFTFGATRNGVSATVAALAAGK